MSELAENGTRENPECSLLKMVKDVSLQGSAQTEAFKDKQKTLQSLQATLSDVEKKCKKVEMVLRPKVRMLLILETDMERLDQHTQALFDRCVSTSRDNTELQGLITEEEGSASAALAGYSAYRKKMEDYRAAVLSAVSQSEAHRELEEKRAQVKMLKQKKEELKEDLEDPNGKSVQKAKKETDALKEQIVVKKKAIAEKREKLQKHSETHIQIKTDIQIQNKRYKATVKRLRCQLNKVQGVHRQMSTEVCDLETQLNELKDRLESSRGISG